MCMREMFVLDETTRSQRHGYANCNERGKDLRFSRLVISSSSSSFATMSSSSLLLFIRWESTAAYRPESSLHNEDIRTNLFACSLLESPFRNRLATKEKKTKKKKKEKERRREVITTFLCRVSSSPLVYLTGRSGVCVYFLCLDYHRRD